MTQTNKINPIALAAILLFISVCLVGLVIFLDESEDALPGLGTPEKDNSHIEEQASIPRRVAMPTVAPAAKEETEPAKGQETEEKKLAITGHVLDPAGHPVKAAFVAIYSLKGETPSHRSTCTVRTNGVGFFEIPQHRYRAESSYVLIANGKKWRPDTRRLEPTDPHGDIVMELATGAEIRGYIGDSSGPSYPQAVSATLFVEGLRLWGCGKEMTWVDGKAENRITRTTSLVDGSFVLSGLTTETYAVAVDGFSHYLAHPALNVPGKKEVHAPNPNVRFDLSCSRLELSIDAQGFRAEGARVEFRDLSSQTSLKRLVSEYNFLSAYLPLDSQIQVTIKHPFFETWTKLVTTPIDGQVIPIIAKLKSAKSADLVVRVKGPGSAKIKALRLDLLPTTEESFITYEIAERARIVNSWSAPKPDGFKEKMTFIAGIGKDGLYRVNVPILDDPNFLLRVRPGRYQPSVEFVYFDILRLKLQDKMVRHVSVVARRGGSVYVQSESASHSIWETTFTIRDKKGDIVFRRKPNDERDFDVEIAQGSFIADGFESDVMPPGTYDLRVEVKNVVKSQSFEIKPGKIKNLIIKIDSD